MLVRQRLLEVALERGLRESTVSSYGQLLTRLGVMDLEEGAVTRTDVLERLWSIDSPNSRRSTVIALKAVLGMSLKIPTAVARRYVLPDEDTLRLALMTTQFEVRGLLMMYAGLRVGEACAVSPKDVSGDRLSVDKQVLYVRTSKTNRLAPVKSQEASVVIPHWLAEQVQSLGEWDKPDTVRHAIARGGKRVGIQLNPHQLRHWYATTLLARGVPLRIVSEQMRHADIATTLRTYSQGDAAASIHDTFG
jgi:integrase